MSKRHAHLHERADNGTSLDAELLARMEFDRLVLMRPEYAATPLNSYSLTRDGAPYIQDAIRYVNHTFTDNLKALPTIPPKSIIDLLEISVNAAVFSRVHENNNKTIPMDTDELSAELFAKACKGFADPEELLTLFTRHPRHLRSIELAKLTHPFDWSATMKMDDEIDNTLTNAGFTRRVDGGTQNVRYLYMRSDNSMSPRAMILIRKADVGVRNILEGSIAVVQQDSLVVNLAHATLGVVTEEARQWLASDKTQAILEKNTAGKVPYELPYLASFINDQLETSIDRRSEALYPGVRSYYARYEKTPAATPPATQE